MMRSFIFQRDLKASKLVHIVRTLMISSYAGHLLKGTKENRKYHALSPQECQDIRADLPPGSVIKVSVHRNAFTALCDLAFPFTSRFRA